MSNTCAQFGGFILTCLGWVGIIIATATNDWVVTCKYDMHTCKKMDELGAKGLWADCIISTALYHCVALTQILTLPAYVQTSRALMIIASILGLPAVALVLMAMPCIRLGNESDGAKHKRAVLGGILILIMALCGIVSTTWFPVGAHQEQSLISFGFSLYAGWVGSVLCLLGSAMVACCHSESIDQVEQSFYYSKPGTVITAAAASTTSHAKTAHV